jgi:hypothetical protein
MQTIGMATVGALNSPTKSAEDFLLDEKDPGLLICSIYEDERPLKGAAGLLDWRLHGFLSRFVLSGRISGNQSEFVYVPVSHHGSLRHVLIVGLGSRENPVQQTLLSKLSDTVQNLKFDRVAVSLSSFPTVSEAQLTKALQSIQVEFVQ